MTVLREPLLHTGITDVLPDDHPLAWTTVYCHNTQCREMLHAGNNENMQPWVESGCGHHCLHCFADITDAYEPEVYALPGDGHGA